MHIVFLLFAAMCNIAYAAPGGEAAVLPSSQPFGSPPTVATVPLRRFNAKVSEKDLQEFKQLLKLSKVAVETFENRVSAPKDIPSFGIDRKWFKDIKRHWETRYEWRKTESRINSFPNFVASVNDNGHVYHIHFAALFSKKRDAVPLILLHGWPGSFLEYLDFLNIMRTKYTQDTLPYHIIVPSLPGYGFSDGPPVDRDFDMPGIARVMDGLMDGLGFGKGYIAHGGDVGSFVARILAVSSDSCKAVHLQLCTVATGDPNDVTQEELVAQQRNRQFAQFGAGYAIEQGTRPSTIGLALSSNPLSLLAWIGEKFISWTDETPSDGTILDFATLWWLTETYPRSIYPYRSFFGAQPEYYHSNPAWRINKPTGYSWFPKEIDATPIAWVATTCDLVWYRRHSSGGHFAALERPQAVVQDIEYFVRAAWPRASVS